MLKSTPEISGEDIVFICNGTADGQMPSSSELANALQIQECINAMPQFFPDKEKIEYNVLASKQSRSMLGSRASMDGNITAYYTSLLLQAHTKMLEYQMGERGSFFLGWYIKAEDRTVGANITVDDKLKTPEGTSGELSTKEIMVSNTSESVEVQGNVFDNELTPLQMSLVTNNSVSKKITWTTVINAVGYAVYKDMRLVARLNEDTVEFSYGANTGTYYVKALGDMVTYSDSETKSIVVS